MKFCSLVRINVVKWIGKANKTINTSVATSPLMIWLFSLYLTWNVTDVDENISYDDTWNKIRVTKENYSWIKKFSTSKLIAINKTVVHNVFAVPKFIPISGVLDWTLDKIRIINVNSRKILTATHNFHINSDLERHWRKQGSGGFTSIQKHLWIWHHIPSATPFKHYLSTYITWWNLHTWNW